MSLPATYYDVLLRRDPEMVRSVRSDLAHLKPQELPFASTDDYQNSFQEYITRLLQEDINRFVAFAQSSGMVGNDNLEGLVENYKNSPDFINLFNSKHLDYIALTNFELFDNKAFHISGNLVEHLSQTSLDVDSELLKLPFESCLLVFNDEIIINAFQAFSPEGSKPDYTTPISVFASSLPAEEGERKIIFACWQANDKQSLVFVKRELLIRKNWSITRALKTDWNDIYEKLGTLEEHNENDNIGFNTDDSIFLEEGLMFFRIIINSILYIGSNQAEIIEKLSPLKNYNKKVNNLKSTAKIKKIKRKIKNSSVLNYSSVGENLPPIIIDKKNQNHSKSTRQNQIQKAKRYIIRGHWRNQPCGKDLKDRKFIWIKPYYKGPEMAELVNKSYVVK